MLQNDDVVDKEKPDELLYGYFIVYYEKNYFFKKIKVFYTS